ncbi:Cytochrome b561 homolog 2 [hydrothermal vent metagenome]|uniref:Cytochrome b561 homolog 2 n=1 Tax=hydrothermal vent metagenome TaxID=652676 RepID=A0A3B1AMR8_9ZZZZ
MSLQNTHKHYGSVTIILHWICAIAVIGMFTLGLWMTSLEYYDPWYHKGPNLHRSTGILLMLLFLLRFIWRQLNLRPEPIGQAWEQAIAELVHRSIYLLIVAIGTSGYLISTADGHSLSVFGWFEIPALITSIERLEDIAGTIHLTLAITLITVAALHALAAFKHHFVNRDPTLTRMLRSAADRIKSDESTQR